jgi:ABC-type antimicrobial peptide transport system permease subunit
LANRTIAGFGRHDLVEVHPLQRTRKAALSGERAMRLGALYFAGLTTLLVFIGLYAVLNLGVIRRLPEIGLRIALGASTYHIRMTVIREALITAAAGLAAGVPCAFASGLLIANSLTLAGPHDAVAVGVAIALIIVVSVLSVLIPLRRAARVTPMEALGCR